MFRSLCRKTTIVTRLVGSDLWKKTIFSTHRVQPTLFEDCDKYLAIHIFKIQSQCRHALQWTKYSTQPELPANFVRCSPSKNFNKFFDQLKKLFYQNDERSDAVVNLVVAHHQVGVPVEKNEILSCRKSAKFEPEPFAEFCQYYESFAPLKLARKNVDFFLNNDFQTRTFLTLVLPATHRD